MRIISLKRCLKKSHKYRKGWLNIKFIDVASSRDDLAHAEAQSRKEDKSFNFQ
ncbi:hypothetical protein FDUTEX481_09197 [Tolypothrix sp. PCC 7601]|nr:hypothetical protein FDUTEX481_09197 [Tolypothrix sp. PCC 7601]